MSRSRIRIAALILVLSSTAVAAVTFAVTREISEYAPLRRLRRLPQQP